MVTQVSSKGQTREGISQAQADPLGDRCGDIPHADRFIDDFDTRRRGRRDHQQRHMHFRAIETRAVGEHSVLAKLFAVVGRHDHQRVLEQTEPLDLVNEKTDLAIEVGDAAILGIVMQCKPVVDDPLVGGVGRGGRSRRQIQDILVDRRLFGQWQCGQAEKWVRIAMETIRHMHIIIINKHEERPSRGSVREPTEDVAIDHRRRFPDPRVPVFAPDRIAEGLNYPPSQAGAPDGLERVRRSGSRRRPRTG
jgi:hypothetical protein